MIRFISEGDTQIRKIEISSTVSETKTEILCLKDLKDQIRAVKIDIVNLTNTKLAKTEELAQLRAKLLEIKTALNLTAQDVAENGG